MDVGARVRDDERHQPLPVVLVRHADHRVVGDFRKLGEGILDRTRIDVFSPGDDHVVFAADDEQPARSVEVAHVPGVHHVVDDVFGITARVAVERQVAADENSPGNVRSNGSAVLVENADRAADNRSAHRLRCLPKVGWRCEGSDPDLR